MLRQRPSGAHWGPAPSPRSCAAGATAGAGAGGAGRGARPKRARSAARVSRRARTLFSHAVRSGSCSISDSTHAPARSFRRLSAVRFAAASAAFSRASCFAFKAFACASFSSSAFIFSSCFVAIVVFPLAFRIRIVRIHFPGTPFSGSISPRQAPPKGALKVISSRLRARLRLGPAGGLAIKFTRSHV